MIEPVDSSERGVFHGPEIAPCPASVDHFGLVEPDKAKKMNIAQGRSRRTCGGYQRLARGELPRCLRIEAPMSGLCRPAPSEFPDALPSRRRGKFESPWGRQINPAYAVADREGVRAILILDPVNDFRYGRASLANAAGVALLRQVGTHGGQHRADLRRSDFPR
jgi:hypothetical protein